MISKIGRYITVALLYVLFIQHNIFAQNNIYIGSYEQEITTRAFLSKMQTILTYEDEWKNKVEYKPNSPLNIGFGFSYKKIGLSASYGVNLASDKNKGKTKALEFQYHYYGRKVMFDLFFHRYKGFYIDTDYPQDGIYVQRPDIGLFQLGFFGQYVFNGDRFSYNATFDQNERQLLSAGSFQVGGGLYYNKVRADSVFLVNSNLESQYEITKIDNVQFGVSAGYAYTWVIKRYYITAAIAVGCNFGVMDVNNYKVNGIDISPSFFPRLATGYNADTWSLNIQLYTNQLYATFSKEHKLSLSSGNGQLTFVKRFSKPRR